MNMQLLRMTAVVGACFMGAFIPLEMLNWVEARWVSYVLDVLTLGLGISNFYLITGEHSRLSQGNPGYVSLGCEILLALPMTTIAGLIQGYDMSWLVIFDLLAVRHLGRIKDFLDEYDSLDPMLYRILPILSGLPLLVHFTSCCWIGLGSGTVGPSAERIDTYIKAVYWSFTTLTTVGYGDISAKTNAQMLFACGVQLVGVCAFGYILSNIIGLINRADAAREHHMDNLERVDTYTRSHRISPELRGKIRAYFHYLWITNKGYQDRSLLESLPRQLQSEIFLHLNKNMFEEVSFLKNAEQDLIVDLMEQLQSRVALPGERIFRAGDEGDALYFIQSGEIQIGGANGEIFAHLHGGEFFGEMALISDRPRSASARAISYADLFVLTKESFDKVSQRYPKFRNSIAEIMKVRQVG